MVKEIVPSLQFNGNCAEALEFYSTVFELEALKVMSYESVASSIQKEMGYSVKADPSRVAHASFKLNNHSMIAYDNTPNFHLPYRAGNPMGLFLDFSTYEALERTYDALVGNKGKIQMKLDVSAWGGFYAIVLDGFGITWELNYQSEKE